MFSFQSLCDQDAMKAMGIGGIGPRILKPGTSFTPRHIISGQKPSIKIRPVTCHEGTEV